MSRLIPILQTTSIQQISPIPNRYWAACLRLQVAVRDEYDALCRNLSSLERYGGISDLDLQEQAARGISQKYEECEAKLAQAILHRLLPGPSIEADGKDWAEMKQGVPKDILRRAFAVHPMPSDAERDYLAKQTGMTYRQVTVWFQNNRSRRIHALPKRGRQQSSRPVSTSSHTANSPPQTASTMTSLHEVEQHLRNPTDSPLAQHITIHNVDRSPQNPLPPLAPPNKSLSQPKVEKSFNNSKPAVVSRSRWLITEPRSYNETRAFDGSTDALSGTNADAANTSSTSRPIAPLRKCRLAGKASSTSPVVSVQQNVSELQQSQNGRTPQQFNASGSATAQTSSQLTPADILMAQIEQFRIASTGSVSTVDSALDGNAATTPSTSRIVSSSSSDSVLTLPFSAITGRSVSGSSAGEVEAMLDHANAGLRNGVNGMAGLVPMFNFLPPTPSNMGFASSSSQAVEGSNSIGLGTNGAASSREQPLQFDPIDFSSFFGFASNSGMHADTAAQNLLKDLDDLDFDAFLRSPETSTASASPSVHQGAFDDRGGEQDESAGSGVAMGHENTGTEEKSADPTQLDFIFEQMSARSSGDEMDIDPAIFEMLKGIIAGSSIGLGAQSHDSSHLSGADTPNAVPPPPASIPVMDDPSRPPSEYDPSLSALAIDLSALFSPRGSLYAQTTPSDVSDTVQFGDSGSPFDEIVTPVMERPVGGSGDLVVGGSGGEGEGEGKEVDWQGLLDFSEMFDAFWTMVDEQGAAGQSQSGGCA